MDCCDYKTSELTVQTLSEYFHEELRSRPLHLSLQRSAAVRQKNLD